jgi:membrane protein DedA with SNARE-associated domain|uniref:Uncharacterized protein n=1 Tax=viral metagenome TaxID=1070528 RepID=A0A6C0IR70_9ZZZZ
MDNYHFGVPSIAIWIQHILSGLLLLYIGYEGVSTGKISRNMSLILIVVGVLAALYHAHLWYYKSRHHKE